MTFQFSIGTWLAPFVDWLNANLHGLFDVIGRVVEAVLGAFQSLLLYPPAIVVILLVTITVALLTGLRVALLAFLCLGFCWLMNLWPQSMQTIALVFTAVVAAVAIAVPLGIMASRRPRLEAALRPILDIMPTGSISG